ncbi:hypothetical protein ACLBOM_08710 [Escherichia coli]
MWPAGVSLDFLVRLIDWEAQYQRTIEHEDAEDVRDESFYWVAFPLLLMVIIGTSSGVEW